jgi:hypothetical protein
VSLPCGVQVWAHGGDLTGGGIANISGRDDSGRAATVYMTALTGGSAAGQLLRVMEVALC